MDITIKIEVDGREVVNHKVEQTEPKVEIPSVDVSQYARFFDEGCPNWSKDPEWNLMFLKQQELYANEMLKRNGFLFLNEVYDMLGFPRTKTGQIVGWIYDEENPIGDNRVDFGIYKTLPGNRNFVNGIERNILLDFNVDGDIFTKMK